jgi:hypothetical protein
MPRGLFADEEVICKAILLVFAPRRTRWGSSGNPLSGFSYEQFRLEGEVLGIRFVWCIDATDEKLGGGPTHFVERLANGCEAGVEILGHDDVVKADYRDVVGA